MEASLRRLRDLDVEILIPGHGPVLRGSGAVRDWLSWMAGYLSEVRAFVACELRAGRNADTIVERLDFRAFVGDRLAPAAFGMADRHRSAARKMAQELSEGQR